MRREVLEVLLVLLIGEDVIAVSTLNLSVLLLLSLRRLRLLVTYLLVLLKALVILGCQVQDFSCVALLENGPLEIVFIDGLEIFRQALVDLKVGNCQEGNPVPHLQEGVAEEHQGEDDPEGNKKRHGWCGGLICGSTEDLTPLVAGLNIDIVQILPGVRELIAEELLAGEHPVSESEVEDGSVGQDAQGILVELLIIHGRLSVHVVQKDLLHAVEGEEGEGCNGEQDGETHAVHHGDEGNVQDGGVLVMDEENGS